MPATIDYKNKYMELRSKYIADLDVAFRLGFEAGAQQAQNQQAVQAQQQNQEMDHQQSLAEAGGMQPGQEGQQPGQEQQGSELDQHIGKLENMLRTNPEVGNDSEIQKSLNAIVNLRKAEKFAFEMRKSEQAISGIAKALHKPEFKLGVQANHNMTDNAKKSVTLQHKIVNDIMEKWNKEESNASKDILAVLDIEHLVKG